MLNCILKILLMGLYYVDFLVSCDEPHNIDDFSYELGQPDYNKKMLKTLIDFLKMDIVQDYEETPALILE